MFKKSFYGTVLLARPLTIERRLEAKASIILRTSLLKERLQNLQRRCEYVEVNSFVESKEVQT